VFRLEWATGEVPAPVQGQGPGQVRVAPGRPAYGDRFCPRRRSSYPRTPTIAFEDAKVNGTVPHLAFADGQALLATGDVFLVPTPFSGDGFQLLPA